jgi:hypothetical protein
MGAPQLRHELALIISAGGLLQSSKFNPKNSIRNFALCQRVDTKAVQRPWRLLTVGC